MRAGWLIVDTFFGVARLGLDKEKDAGAVDAAVAPMKTIAAELDVAVTLTRHERKSGGDIGDSGRDSALTGACDIVLQLTRSASRPTMRQLEITGRIDPDKLTIELKDGTYISHGEFGEFRIAAAEKDEALDKAISDNPQATNEQLGRMVNISRNDIAARAAKLGWERAKGIGAPEVRGFEPWLNAPHRVCTAPTFYRNTWARALKQSPALAPKRGCTRVQVHGLINYINRYACVVVAR